MSPIRLPLLFLQIESRHILTFYVVSACVFVCEGGVVSWSIL